MKNRYTILLIEILLTCNYLYSQSDFKPGYIVSLSNDTSYGFIDYRNEGFNAENCIFKKSVDKEKVSYKPEEIKSYYLNEGRYYISEQIVIDSVLKYVFLELLLHGKMDLFYYNPKSEGLYFIKIDTGNIIFLDNREKNKVKIYGSDCSVTYNVENKRYKGILKYQLQDCPEIKSQIDNLYLDQKNLIKLAEDYHNYTCVGWKCVKYRKNKSGILVSFGPIVNYFINSAILSKNGYNIEELDILKNFSYGMGAEISTNSKFNRLSLLVNYFHLKYNYNFSIVNPGINTYKVVFNTIDNCFTVCLGYKYPKFKVKPLISAGFYYYLTTSGHIDSYDTDIRKQIIGINLNAGINYNLRKRLYFVLQFQYLPNGVANYNGAAFYFKKFTTFGLNSGLYYTFGKLD
jgi:hypothetical protein